MAIEAVEVVQKLIREVEAAYLFGSAAEGGLRADSDVDVLIVTKKRLAFKIRKKLTGRLMEISGKIGNPQSVRPLELTVVHLNEVVPWNYPPKREFIYGEWMRGTYEDGYVPGQTADPDLVILLHSVRLKSIPLIGLEACQLLEPVPQNDLYRAIKESLPVLLSGLEGDERNVILTLSRMWFTTTTGKMAPKDIAAAWAEEHLPQPLRPIMVLARRTYLGEIQDCWNGKSREATLLAGYIRKKIETRISHAL